MESGNDRCIQEAFACERDGMTLRGMSYRPATPEAGAKRFPTVIFLHGFTGSRVEAGFLFVQLARELCTRGIAAITFDFMHSGESDGSFDRMLVTGEIADALAVTAWAQGQPFVDRSRLGLLGFSLGGLVATCAAARSDAFKTLTLIAPTTVENISRFARDPEPTGGAVGGTAEGSPRGNATGVKDGDGAPRIRKGPYYLHEGFFDDVTSLDPLSDCAKIAAPTLILQGDDDDAVPPHVSQKYIEGLKEAGAPLTSERLKGANHIFHRPWHRDQLRKLLGDWTAKHLVG